MNKYSGIIFDFNGVLLWDSTLHELTWNEVAKKLRNREFDEREFEEIVHGRPARYIIEYLIDRSPSAEEEKNIVNEKENAYKVLLQRGDLFRLSPGAENLLNYLVAKNIPHNIATSSGKNNLDFFVKYLKLEKWFDINKIVYDDGVIRGKPYPDMYIKAAQNMDLTSNECIVVEDAVTGIVAAHEAGIGKIYALGPKSKHSFLKNIPGVNEVISNLGEIPHNVFNA